MGRVCGLTVRHEESDTLIVVNDIDATEHQCSEGE